MSDLDEKLREILYKRTREHYEGSELQMDAEAITELKQAFADEIQPMLDNITNLANHALTVPSIQYVKPNKATTEIRNLMSGQAWYERFTEEFNKEYLANPRDILADPLKVLEAAKKAAGIAPEAER